ncbi:MAG: hypothetical protein MUD00_03730 [Candidatus Pacebacteria bacterium]|jgi:hypothetical protein|nr:hypothetical protein [Candidatus Paceibacterota bacterium]
MHTPQYYRDAHEAGHSRNSKEEAIGKIVFAALSILFLFFCSVFSSCSKEEIPQPKQNAPVSVSA